MEALLELLLALFVEAGGVLAELVYQLVFELLTEVGIRSFSRRRPSALLAAVGYALAGGALGGLSVLLRPELVIRDPQLALAHFVVSPILAGLAMVAVGALRRHRGQALVRLDTFAYGWLFAVAFATVRLLLAR